MPQSRSVRDDRSNLELVHRRMINVANTYAHFAVLLAIAAITVFTSVYLYLGTLNLEMPLKTIIRTTASLLLTVPILWYAKSFAQGSMRFSETARAIELELHVDKTLEKHRIREPPSKWFKEPSKRNR